MNIWFILMRWEEIYQLALHLPGYTYVRALFSVMHTFNKDA